MKVAASNRHLLVSVLLGSIASLALVNAAGCSSDSAKETGGVETRADAGKRPDRTTSDELSDDELSDDDDSAPDDSSYDPIPEEPVTGPDGGDEPVVDPTAPQTKSCTASAGEHKSFTEVVFTVDKGMAKLSSMTVKVTNKEGRDQNDIVLYVTPPDGSENNAFESGDILANGKTVKIPLSPGFAVKVGSRLRIETNFDERFGDPHASCFVQL